MDKDYYTLEITFEYELYGTNKWYEGYLDLSEQELSEVFDVLEANPDAKFEDLPKELYAAFQQAAEKAVMEMEIVPGLGKEYGYRVDLQKEMPQSLLSLYEDYAEQKEDDDFPLVR